MLNSSSDFHGLERLRFHVRATTPRRMTAPTFWRALFIVSVILNVLLLLR